MKSIKVLYRYIKRQLFLHKEETDLETYQEIEEGVVFRGHNLWILSFAMIIASIGLTTDSITALIGAMLISPLMGPVVGFAYGMAINDTDLKKKSFYNWLLMNFISLMASTIYFIISPFDEDTTALQSFTKASIFDIALAFFGGAAGLIGIVKKEGTKIIAGVAIATACMPPLCTAAYGIAHLDLTHFLGGLYFYLINCLFIGLATFIMTRYLGFRQRNRPVQSHSLANWLWVSLIILMMIPGIYIAYQKWKEQKIIHASKKNK
ncbi:MAG: DUF389 domain-containing protein [Bacteroidia bacterium]|nr:DUF389 domain-containing protein [Bacteroidia bacterium]